MGIDNWENSKEFEIILSLALVQLLQQTFNCSNSAIEELEKGVKYVQS